MLAVIAAGGPSLRREDVESCRDRAFLIVINDTWQMAPWADVLYAADYGWWLRRRPPVFAGDKYGCNNQNIAQFGVTVLKSLGYLGWSDDPNAVYAGGHSGFQAIQMVASRYGAKQIALLGYDLKADANGNKNWYENRKTKPFDRWLDTYATLASAAKTRGIEIVNCSRDTALTAFPRQSLAEVLCDLPRSALRA